MVCPYFLPVIGGMENYIYSLSKELVKLRNKVVVFTCDRNRDNSEIKNKKEFIDGIEVRRIKTLFRLGPNTNFFPKLTSELRNFDVINIHNYGHPHHFFSILAGKSYKTPVVLTGHAPNEVTKTRSKLNAFISSLREFLFSKYLLRNSNKIISVMPSETEWLVKQGADRSRITFIPIGVDEIFFRKKLNKNFRKENHLEKNKIILSAGRIEKRKGYEFLVVSASLVVQKHPEAVFVVAGQDFGYKEEMVSKIKKLKLEKNFIFLGAVKPENMPDLYLSSDVFVMPSIHEGGPLTVPEAMACRIPVVSTRTGTVEYYLKNGELGNIVEYGNAEKLSEMIIKNIEKKDKIRIKKARLFSESLVWKNLVYKYLEVYKWALK